MACFLNLNKNYLVWYHEGAIVGLRFGKDARNERFIEASKSFWMVMSNVSLM